ncbi:MAG: hypothetical protein ACI4NP_03140 [Thermoguttaceae bacterium]
MKEVCKSKKTTRVKEESVDCQVSWRSGDSFESVSFEVRRRLETYSLQEDGQAERPSLDPNDRFYIDPYAFKNGVSRAPNPEEDDFDDEFDADFEILPEEGFDEIEEELEQEELQREKQRQEAYKKEKEKNGGKSSGKSGAAASCADLADAGVPTDEEIEKEFDAMETSDYEYGGIED